MFWRYSAVDILAWQRGGTARGLPSWGEKMEAELKREIEDLLQNNQVVLFMKGSKNFPQCGFSATVVSILKDAGVRDFKDINILQRADLRDGMKEWASWPTFPQLYVKGEFVGGC